MRTVSSDELDAAFETWWYAEGLDMVPTGALDDGEGVKALCRVAWRNGAYKQIETGEV